jgi:mRNA-degrading endonuclease RelE of RelBE toxin-antitoxin system
MSSMRAPTSKACPSALTTYRLEFLPYARKELDKLGATLREQLKTQLGEWIEHPLVQADALREWE